MATHNEDVLSLQAGDFLEGLLETLSDLALVLVTVFDNKVSKSQPSTQIISIRRSICSHFGKVLHARWSEGYYGYQAPRTTLTR